jgi:hypothetical protein
MRRYLDGPSIGPLRTVLASGRIGGRRKRRRGPAGPWRPRRFRTVRYWLLGLYAVEVMFWTVYGLGWAAAWCWHRYRAG